MVFGDDDPKEINELKNELIKIKTEIEDLESDAYHVLCCYFNSTLERKRGIKNEYNDENRIQEFKSE